MANYIRGEVAEHPAIPVAAPIGGATTERRKGSRQINVGIPVPKQYYGQLVQDQNIIDCPATPGIPPSPSPPKPLFETFIRSRNHITLYTFFCHFVVVIIIIIFFF